MMMMMMQLRRRLLANILNIAGSRTRFLSTATTPRKLEGKVALITGGASGIGLATAKEFAENGATVLIADMDEHRGNEAAAQIMNSSSSSSFTTVAAAATFVKCDVREEADVAAAVDTAVARFGRLDVMFNNAGITGNAHPTPLCELSTADFDAVMAVNLRGMILGTKHAARVMVARNSDRLDGPRGGCILCTASITGILGGVAPLAYSVSKFAVAGLVRCAAAELAPHGVRVNGISPFAIATPFALDPIRPYYRGLTEEQLAQLLHAAGDLKAPPCSPMDVAKAALYLASDDARYVTGHNLVVDGGFTVIKPFRLPPPPSL